MRARVPADGSSPDVPRLPADTAESDDDFDPVVTAAADVEADVANLALPLVGGLDVKGRIAEALDSVTATRRGVVVVGPRGMGKSIALRQAVTGFHRREVAREARDPGYRRRVVLPMPALSTRGYLDGLTELCRKVIGPSFSPRARGGLKKVDDLLHELIATCLDQNIVAFTVDEADRCSPEVLRLLRDLLADAEWHDDSRLQIDDTLRAGGVGVLAVGTPTFRPIIERSEDARQRWSLLVDLTTAKPLRAADVYAAWFPGFAPRVAEMGAAAWEAYLTKHITFNRPVAFRWLEAHARRYYRLVQQAQRDKHLPLISRAETPLRPKFFERAAEDLRWGSEGGAA